MTATQVLGFAGILLIIGFVADYLFRKTSFPDILVLLALGYLVGPLLNVVDPSKIVPASQIVASLAVAVILFNGGLNLELARVLSTAPRAIALVVLGTAISMASTAAFAWYFLDWEALNSLLLGAMVSGTSPAIVMPLISRAKVPVQVSSLLKLESAFDGALVIVLGLAIVEIMTTGDTQHGVSIPTQAILIRFLLGAVIGVAAGVVWLRALASLEGETYDDILTLAVLLLLYFGVEFIEGSGIIFALVFGLVLGNGITIARQLRIKRTVELHEPMKKFHSQMSFVIKTFFFVLLGLTITLDEPSLILQGVVLSLILLCARHVAVLFTSIGGSVLLTNRGMLTTMLPRGLSAAVVTQTAVAAEIPDASVYPDIITVIIVATIVISAMGILLFARKPLEEGQEDQPTGKGVVSPRKRVSPPPPKQIARPAKEQGERTPSRRKTDKK